MTADSYAALLAAGQRKIATASADAGVPVPMPSPAHDAVLGALDELLGAITANAANLPMAARAMLGMVTTARGQVVDGLARMPEAQLLTVLRSVGERIVSVPGVLDLTAQPQ